MTIIQNLSFQLIYKLQIYTKQTYHRIMKYLQIMNIFRKPFIQFIK